ncbi:MAG: ribonuclease HI [Candidatus Binataceae bacterium]|nr:ribonuclease HI [Candidatus Binataceae bacterium]
MASSKPILVYADGSCLGNPGPGGWGTVIIAPDGSEIELSGAEAHTTNNRMEITAALEALRHLDPQSDVVLRTDSQYLVKTMNDGWRRRENRDLWEELDAAVRRHRAVKFEWVRGHAGDPLNERADGLALRAAGGKPAGALAAGRRSPRASLDAQAVALASMLQPGETIRVCAGCGRRFVAAAISGNEPPRHCALVDCQFKARSASR